jgi:hypothetical protein
VCEEKNIKKSERERARERDRERERERVRRGATKRKGER